MRTRRAVINGLSGLMVNLPVILLGLVYQRVFIEKLGADYLGISGLFTNIISMLSIAELGIGTAIVFHLYEPIAEKDNKRINELVNYYRNCYFKVVGLILFIGLIIMGMLPYLTGTVNLKENLTIIYLLFLLDCVASYCFVYKQSILNADQHNYLINIGLMFCRSLTYISQMIFLQFSKNYYIFLIIGIILRLCNNLVLGKVTDKKYPDIKECRKYQLKDQEIIGDISKKIKASIFHRVGSFIVVGSDNILISILCGIQTVGFYSNYNMIISALKSIVTQCFSAITSSVGNLLVTTEHTYQYKIYCNIHYLNYIMASFVSLCLWGLMDSWISVWIGSGWLLARGALFIITVNLFLMLMRNTMNVFKEAAGIVYEDRYVPVIESVVNLVCSILFFKFFGLAGIFLGTVCSNLVLHLYSYPYFVYHRVFHRPYKQYYAIFTKGLLLFLMNLLTVIAVQNINSLFELNFLLELLFIVLFVGIILITESIFLYKEEFKACLCILGNKNVI